MASQHDPDSLKAVSLLPPPFRPLFRFRYFNAVQSECFAEVFLSDINMVISAPTGSGKTVAFELCILRLLSRFLTPEGQFIHAPGTLKTVYIAPTKALVQEKVREWKERFGQFLGLKCQELTGDCDISSIKSMQETDIILTTPEKFDAITRRGRDHGNLSFFADIALLEIDEVHLLSETRGAALEAVVSRMKMLSRYPEMKGFPLSTIRMVAVSATIPNVEDIAEWLRVPGQGLKRFGEEMRPVKLSTRVYGYSPAKNDFLFERRLQSFLFEILQQHSHGKPALVFCSTRKGAQEAALTLVQAVSKTRSNPFIKTRDQYDRLQLAAISSRDKHLQTCIKCGVGYHNGGLDLNERNLVEGLFLKGDLLVLCTTNTLAHGVNLPAHTVVIKSTQYFNKGKGCYVEYDRSTLIQMCGRAGRPQFDDTGIVIVMTRRDTVHLYENLLSGSEMVESQLLPTIAEHLNAEIVLMTVSDVSLAIEWLKGSFLFVRIKKNPPHYRIQKVISEDQLEKNLKDICLRNITELASFGLIQTDEYGFLLKPLEPGRLMTKYYINFQTMKAITEIPENSSMEDLVHVLSKSQELSWIKLRRDEKKLLNDINNDGTGRIKFHIVGANGKIKKRIQTAEEKIFVLVNDALTGEPSALDFTLSQDVNGICMTGTRIFRCMGEYFKSAKRFKDTVHAFMLAKCLQQRVWDDSPYKLKQLPGIGMVTAKALLLAGIDSFEKLANSDPRRLESTTGRKYPFGNQVKEALEKLPPKVVMEVQQPAGKNDIIITLSRMTDCKASGNWHMAHLMAGLVESNKLLFHEKIGLQKFPSPYSITVHIEKSVLEAPMQVMVILISEEYVGIDIVEKIQIAGMSAQTRLNQDNFASRPRNHKRVKDSLVLETKQAKQRLDSEYQGIGIQETLQGLDRPTFKLLPEELEYQGAHHILNYIQEKAKYLPQITKFLTTSISRGSLQHTACSNVSDSPGMSVQEPSYSVYDPNGGMGNVEAQCISGITNIFPESQQAFTAKSNLEIYEKPSDDMMNCQQPDDEYSVCMVDDLGSPQQECQSSRLHLFDKQESLEKKLVRCISPVVTDTLRCEAPCRVTGYQSIFSFL